MSSRKIRVVTSNRDGVLKLTTWLYLNGVDRVGPTGSIADCVRCTYEAHHTDEDIERIAEWCMENGGSIENA